MANMEPPSPEDVRKAARKLGLVPRTGERARSDAFSEKRDILNKINWANLFNLPLTMENTCPFWIECLRHTCSLYLVVSRCPLSCLLTTYKKPLPQCAIIQNAEKELFAP